MQSTLPPIGELLAQVLQQWRAQAVVFWKIALLLFLVNTFPLITKLPVIASSAWVNLLDNIIFWLTVFLRGWLVIVLVSQIVSQEKTFAKGVFSSALNLTGKYFVLNFLITAIVLGGAVLLIVPGVILAVWASFASFFLILEGKGIAASLYASRNCFKGREWPLFSRMIWVLAPFFLLHYIKPRLSNLFSLSTTVFSDLLVNGLLGLLTVLEIIYAYILYQHLKNAEPISDMASNKFKALLAVTGTIGVFILVLAGIISLFPVGNTI